LFIESSRLPGVDRGGFDTGPGNDLSVRLPARAEVTT
jgi:hypothetical protein